MWAIFKDDNDYNEKSIIGFASFAVMTLFAIVDLGTGIWGKDLVINDMVYNSFVFVNTPSHTHTATDAHKHTQRH